MIFLDAERFIAEAIESVIAQTYPVWELLLVDDGSSDGSTAVAKGYAARMPARIRYLEHDGHIRRGTAASRNAGMHAARGDYIAFLDSDDVYLPERLRRHVNAFTASASVDVVLSGELYWWSWGTSRHDDVHPLGDRVFVPQVTPGVPFDPPNLLVIMLEAAGAATPAPCSMSFRRRLALDLGGIPERFTSLYEDQALLAKLLLHGRAVVLDEWLAKYRQHPQSLTRRARDLGEYRPGRMHVAEFDYLCWLHDYVIERGCLTPRLEAALTRQRWPYDHPREAWIRDLAARTGDSLREILRALAERALPRATLDEIRTARLASRDRREAERVRSIERSVMSGNPAER